MLMYTSCGWFFDELSGIETVQVIQYAGRVVQLADELFGDALETSFLDALERARATCPRSRTAGKSTSATCGRRRSTCFESERTMRSPRCSSAARRALPSRASRSSARITAYFDAGRARLGFGRARIRSRITREEGLFTFGVLHFSGHNVNGGVGPYRGEEPYETLLGAAASSFSRGDLPEVIRQLDAAFGKSIFSLKQLFRDEQRRIVGMILASALSDTESLLRQSYDRNQPMMRFLEDLATPLPGVIHAIAEFVVNSELRRAAADEDLDQERIAQLIEDAGRERIVLDAETLEFHFRRRLEALARRLADQPESREALEALEAAVAFAGRLPFRVQLWEVQNVVYDILQKIYPRQLERSGGGDEEAKAWVHRLRGLAEAISVAGPAEGG